MNADMPSPMAEDEHEDDFFEECEESAWGEALEEEQLGADLGCEEQPASTGWHHHQQAPRADAAVRGRVHAAFPGNSHVSLCRQEAALHLQACEEGPLGPHTCTAADITTFLNDRAPQAWSALAELGDPLRALCEGEACLQLRWEGGNDLVLCLDMLSLMQAGPPVKPAHTPSPPASMPYAPSSEGGTSVEGSTPHGRQPLTWQQQEQLQPAPPPSLHNSTAPSVQGRGPWPGASAAGSKGPRMLFPPGYKPDVIRLRILAHAAYCGGAAAAGPEALQTLRRLTACYLAGCFRGPLGPHSLRAELMFEILQKEAPAALARVPLGQLHDGCIRVS